MCGLPASRCRVSGCLSWSPSSPLADVTLAFVTEADLVDVTVVFVAEADLVDFTLVFVVEANLVDVTVALAAEADLELLSGLSARGLRSTWPKDEQSRWGIEHCGWRFFKLPHLPRYSSGCVCSFLLL